MVTLTPRPDKLMHLGVTLALGVTLFLTGPAGAQPNALEVLSAQVAALEETVVALQDQVNALEEALSAQAQDDNTSLGTGALASNTEGESNTAIGATALFRNTTGSQNTASGANALASNTEGESNTASGAGALFQNTTGSQNTASGANALASNIEGESNTASGASALFSNTEGNSNTAIGAGALASNTEGDANTAIGFQADVAAGDLTNATAIGQGAVVDASHKIRLGNTEVTVIEGPVALTSVSDKTKKERFQPVDGEAVLDKIRGLALSSWNFIGHDPKQFRHYGPMAQDVFAAFGHDGIGQIGSETTINAGDLAGILMSAVQALAQRTVALKQQEAQMAVLEATVEQQEAQMAVLEANIADLQAKYASLEAVAARLEALELQKNPALQITAEQRRGDQLVDVRP
jgi:trimeric autotransporter adhesin